MQFSCLFRWIGQWKYDSETDGLPSGWSGALDTWEWQADGAPIFTDDGDSGEVFIAHSPGGGAVKIWGDYNQNPVNPESTVYQNC